MEASGSPTTPPPPPPPATERTDDDKPSGGWRALAVILALALLFAALVLIVFAADTSTAPLCTDRAGVAKEIAEEGADAQCWDNSETQKTISVAAAWPGGILAALAGLVALFFAVTGRHGRLVLQLTAGALLFGAISILVGNL